MYNNYNQIKLVEELTQEQLDILKSLVYWNDTRLADYSTLNTAEQEQVAEALFEADISNDIIYKLFYNIYFTDNALEKVAEGVA